MGAVRDLKTDMKGSIDHMVDRLDRFTQESGAPAPRKRPPRTGE
jgi:hypothetical protein